MYGLSAVALAVLRSSSSRARGLSAAMPSTQRSRNTFIASRRIVDACSAFQAMTGIITFSSSWPASHASATVSVAAHHLEAHLVDHLRHRRIDLAGHDRRTGLHRRQRDLRQPGARPHAEQPQVARDLADLDRQPPHRARVGEHVAHALRDAKQIRRRRSAAGSCTARDSSTTSRRKSSPAFRPVPTAVAPMFSSSQLLRRLRHVVGAAPHAFGVAAELLAERDRHRVLQMRAAGLQHAGELVRFPAEALGERVRRRRPAAPRRAAAPAASRSGTRRWSTGPC